MKTWAVTVEATFTLRASKEDTAQKRAAQMAEQLGFPLAYKLPEWYEDNLEWGEVVVEEEE